MARDKTITRRMLIDDDSDDNNKKQTMFDLTVDYVSLETLTARDFCYN